MIILIMFIDRRVTFSAKIRKKVGIFLKIFECFKIAVIAPSTGPFYTECSFSI